LFRVKDLRFRLQGLGLKAKGLRFRVQGIAVFRV
jgi:hypothetical protein